eukprot:gb/GFBE01002260.1/.p1 GENE.gb/GFBE01002260.1/~~gb/GFBE01002260.1/.p1  ORF type:complete len:345 (+),score=51.91 gb/GFBE01002260.1/:1-1035(+)
MVNVEVLGLLAVTVGINCSVVANSFVKLLKGLPLLQVVAARFLLQSVVTIAVVAALRSYGQPIRILGPPGQRHLLVIRAICFSASLGCSWSAIQVLPLGIATSILYCNPVICGLLVHYVLKLEVLTPSFFAQAFVSLIGVVLIAFPVETEKLEPRDVVKGVVLAFTAAVLMAVGQSVIRLMDQVHPIEIELFQDVITALVFVPCCFLFSGGEIVLSDWTSERIFYLAMFTLAGLAACFLVITGFVLAPVTKATLFTYVEVPSSFLAQVLYFHHVPRASKIVGASLIVLSVVVKFLAEAWSQDAAAARARKGHPSPEELTVEDSGDLVEQQPLLSDIRDEQGEVQ